MSGIRISEKHGVNPSMDMCFWCGETKAIVLFGRLKNDAEAPREVVTNYEPCDKCKEIIKKGCWCVEVDTSPTDRGRAPIQEQGDKKLYPTGRFHVLKKEAAARIFGENGVTEESKMVFIDKGVFEWIHQQYEAATPKKRKLAKKPSAWKSHCKGE